MIRSIRELKKQMHDRLREEQIERDEEGRAVVKMTVLRDEDFLSDFSAGSIPVISSQVAEFIEERTSAFSPQEPLSLNIYSDCIDSQEKIVYDQALKEYYVRHYSENKRELVRNTFISAIMAAVGILALTVVILFYFFERHPVLTEIVDIFAWVFLWEAVDLFFLQRSVLRGKRARYLRLIEAKIKFLPLEEAANS